MGKEKIKRVIRSGNLTAEEAARDEQIRRQVEEEFPPAHPHSPPVADSISETLKRAIEASGRSVDEIARDAGVSRNMVMQFLSGQRDIHITAADRLASSLGLQLIVEQSSEG